MWAGCIWVPIYEVMTRKHLKLVTLEENLEMAADIGIDATTSLDEAFAEAMERHGPDAKVIVLPFARYQLPAEHGADGRGAAPLPAGGARALNRREGGANPGGDRVPGAVSESVHNWHGLVRVGHGFVHFLAGRARPQGKGATPPPRVGVWASTGAARRRPRRPA